MEDGPELGASCVINSIPNLAICPHIIKGLLILFGFSYNIFGGSSRSFYRISSPKELVPIPQKEISHT